MVGPLWPGEKRSGINREKQRERHDQGSEFQEPETSHSLSLAAQLDTGNPADASLTSTLR
jgi:hypothetical protein